jgi:hypothetical protein
MRPSSFISPAMWLNATAADELAAAFDQITAEGPE